MSTADQEVVTTESQKEKIQSVEIIERSAVAQLADGDDQDIAEFTSAVEEATNVVTNEEQKEETNKEKGEVKNGGEGEVSNEGEGEVSNQGEGEETNKGERVEMKVPIAVVEGDSPSSEDASEIREKSGDDIVLLVSEQQQHSSDSAEQIKSISEPRSQEDNSQQSSQQEYLVFEQREGSQKDEAEAEQFEQGEGYRLLSVEKGQLPQDDQSSSSVKAADVVESVLSGETIRSVDKEAEEVVTSVETRSYEQSQEEQQQDPLLEVVQIQQQHQASFDEQLVSDLQYNSSDAQSTEVTSAVEVVTATNESEKREESHQPATSAAAKPVIVKQGEGEELMGGEESVQQSREIQYQYLVERQRRQNEFERQMEELNKKYKINFRTIVDVRSETMSGNYLAGLLAIKMGYKYVDTKDQFGFTMLHNAVLNNERELVLFLLNSGADVNMQDTQQRTGLMMAAYGGSALERNKDSKANSADLKEESEEFQKVTKLHSFNKIFKILIDRGACFQQKDIYQFTALLYSLQTQNLLIFFYLIYLGGNIYDCDMNGSSVVHWNAYKGNAFLMRVFRSLNLDMTTADNQNFTPFQRALLGISYETVEYLAKTMPAEQIPDPKLKSDDGQYVISSSSIRKLFVSLREDHKKVATRLLNWWEANVGEDKNCYPSIGVFIATALVLFYSAFTVINAGKVMSHSGSSSGGGGGLLSHTQFVINILFFISTFFYMSFSVKLSQIIVSYKQRNKGTFVVDSAAIDRPNQLKLEQLRQTPSYMLEIMKDQQQYQRILSRMNFRNIDKLLENANFQSTSSISLDSSTIQYDEEEGLTSESLQKQQQQLTFIHEIAILFENNYFTSLGELNFKSLCGVCLKYKPEKTKHCEKCNCCVAYYSFHSTLFNTCICAENYIFYIIHLLSLWSSLLTFITIYSAHFSPLITSWQIFKYIEIPFIVSNSIGLYHAIVYIIALISFLYVSLDVALEVIATIEDKTRDEILHPFDYPYNFEVLADKKGTLLKVPKIRTTGIIDYIKQIFFSFYYRNFVNLKARK